MRTVRLYGFTSDFGSYAQVTSGFAEGLRDIGYGETLDVHSIDTERSFDEVPTGLPFANIAILTGPPIAAAKLTNGSSHSRRLVMVHPNSDKLPQRTMQVVNTHATELLVSSEWSQRVVQGYTDKPVTVVPHGIAKAINPDGFVCDDTRIKSDYASGRFRILHLSSTAGQRKGTLELCKAFRSAVRDKLLPPESELVLSLSSTDAQVELLDWVNPDVPDGKITMLGRVGLRGAPPAQMRKLYNSFHLVCQPSRGEGFGFVPLEALCAGTPIAATIVTGHSEWFRLGLPGAMPISTHERAPIDDMVGATAPRLEPADVAFALEQAYHRWALLHEEARQNAFALATEWRWKKKLEPLIERFLKEQGD